MPRVRISRASLLLSLILAAPLLAGQPDRRQQLATWLTQLGDREPQTRQIARRNLLGLSSTDLPALRQIIATGHLTPAQLDPLEEIITYVSTRNTLIDERGDTASPFLGVSMAAFPALRDDADDNSPELGVVVDNRLFGYVAYRYLENGDVITALGRDGDLKPTHTSEELRAVVQTFSPGQTITVSLLRNGTPMTTRFAIDYAPQAAVEKTASPSQLEALIDRVRGDAQTVYDQQFRPLIDPAT